MYFVKLIFLNNLVRSYIVVERKIHHLDITQRNDVQIIAKRVTEINGSAFLTVNGYIK